MSESVPEREPVRLPEELPPVQPPSAAFIAQLFLVPAVIVGGIILAWLVVNRLAQGDRDWRALVQELRSPDSDRRWRGAFGLAQLLQSDRQGAPDQERLVNNPEIAQSLAGMLSTELKKSSTTEDEINQQAFLAGALGLLDVPDVVAPALREALDERHDLEIRKNALKSIAVILNRSASENQQNPLQELLPDVVRVSADPNPLMRLLAAHALGFYHDPSAVERLKVLLSDADLNTRGNAAVALARQGSTACLEEIDEMLRVAAAPEKPGSKPDPKFDAYNRLLLQTNALKALGLLAPKLTAEQRVEWIDKVTPIAKSHQDVKVRVEANAALQELQKSAAK